MKYILTIILALLVVSCKKEEIQRNDLGGATKSSIILKPIEGQEWHYQVELEAFTDIVIPTFPEKSNLRRAENESGFPKINYREKRVYKGKENIKGHKDVLVFEIFLGDVLTKSEYGMIEQTVYSTVGVQEQYPQSDPVIFANPITMFDEKHVGGEIWQIDFSGISEGSSLLRQLRTIGIEDVSTELNSYKGAIHVQVTGPGYPHHVIRDMWFVPRVGLVKEIMTRFTEEKVAMRETKVLERIVN